MLLLLIFGNQITVKAWKVKEILSSKKGIRSTGNPRNLVSVHSVSNRIWKRKVASLFPVYNYILSNVKLWRRTFIDWKRNISIEIITCNCVDVVPQWWRKTIHSPHKLRSFKPQSNEARFPKGPREIEDNLVTALFGGHLVLLFLHMAF